MKVTLTISDKRLIGEMNRYHFDNIVKSEYVSEAQEIFDHWFEKVDLKTTVLVCFENFGGLKDSELRDEQRTFLVSHFEDDITEYVEQLLGGNRNYDIDLAVFAFSSYKEAFEYCIDLKESF